MVKSTRPKFLPRRQAGATSYKDTASGVLPRSKVVQLEREGIKKALEYIIKLSQEKAQITSQLIRGVHKEGFSFIFPDWAGHFRTIDVTVGEYEPPHHSRIPELVKSLCDDLSERLSHLPSPEQENSF